MAAVIHLPPHHSFITGVMLADLGPLTVFIPLIAVEICLDYHVHIAQKFLVSQGTTNARIQAATAVGKTVLKSGSTMLLGMASLLLAPGKAAYVRMVV
eukprot:SAG31_NODE_1069_length_10077_cov_2.403588_11_plen_98_part_00